MMGPDCERISSGIDGVKDALVSGIQRLANASAYQITTTGTHGESETPHPASGFTTGAVAALAGLSPDIGKMNTLQGSLFTSVSSWHNSYGSPWTELNNLSDAVNAAAAADNVVYMGDRVKLMGLMCIALNRAVDAKQSLGQNNDYVQRGYDHKFNGDNPSITFKDGLNKITVGNVEQGYTENVNVPKPSKDPF